jgi:hypothetical protein
VWRTSWQADREMKRHEAANEEAVEKAAKDGQRINNK